MAYDDIPIVRADLVAIGDISSADCSPFIATAKLMVDENLLDQDHSDERLKAIWTYLAGHFALLKEGHLKSETVGPTASSFNMVSGLGLKSTTLGQQAIMLDASGTLFLLDNPTIETVTPKRVSIAVY